MHLSSLTLKGFKSFARSTVFAFEPGVTCIVGPNGSGKSNVVDALAWVMGEQGAKTLRGSAMSDVIFAGTATRGPLGRAEVLLTIDNSDGALPIEYGEVTISRTLFRSGSSEYAINGEPCRLLDVQELLSDTGLGREMHVIVGQGQLDAVLRASADERRGFIEEAAGILKHRRRKERTERKLEAMQANLTRLTDLAGEVRRQLTPLGAQAETAREAQRIQAEARQARGRLAAHEVGELDERVGRAEEQLQRLSAERQVAEDAATGHRARVTALESQGDAASLDAARRTALELESAEERVRGLAQLAATRAALLDGDEAQPVAVSRGEDREAILRAVDEVEAALGGVEAALTSAERHVAETAAALDLVDAAVAERAAEVAAHDVRLSEHAGRLRAAEQALAARAAEVERRGAAATAAAERADAAVADLAAVPEPEPVVVAAAAEPPDGRVRAATAQHDRVRARRHELERTRDAETARAAALALALGAGEAGGELLDAAPPGLQGRLVDAVRVRQGWEQAVGAALGPLVDALLTADLSSAIAVLDRAETLGAVDVVVAGAAVVEAGGSAEVGDLPGLSLDAVLSAPPGVLAALARVRLVEHRAEALEAAEQHPEVAFVTRAGESVGGAVLRSPGTARSRIALRQEREAALVRLTAATEELGAVRGLAEAAATELRAARAEAAREDERRRSAERRAQEASRRRASLAARAEAAVGERARLERQAAEAQAEALQAEAVRLAAEQALAAALAAPRPALGAEEREPLALAVEAARGDAVSARLALGTLRERRRAELQRLEQHDREAAAAARAVAEAARRAAIRAAERAATASVHRVLPALGASLARSVAEARQARDELERRRAEQYGELAAAHRQEAQQRGRSAELGERLRDLEMTVYGDRLARGAVLERALAQLGLDAAGLAAEHGGEPLDRDAEERRLRAAERRLGQLGRVNPLALEEFAALEQRHVFLTEQLADLERARADLQQVIAELDAKMRTIFADAFIDTAAAFAEIFPVLFPGGSGELSLTDSRDLAATGVEVAARPAGKRVERLSLLSGGERSLAAVAFLIAIFRARPSPFYILDEVEAALDDANLGRLLQVVDSLRAESQLILITHQKRTMGIADVLYGVSMRQDGVSAVIGQRVAART